MADETDWLIDWCFTARQHKIGQFVPIYQGDYWLRRLRIANEEHTTIKTQTQAFISSRLDYCNAGGLLSRLQSVQNDAARLVTGLGWQKHITPVLQQLHCCQFVSMLCSSRQRWSTARLQELHWPTCPTSVTSHVYLVAHTTVTVIAVLLLPVLVYETVCRWSFVNQTFRSTVLNCIEDVVVLGVGDRGLCDKSLRAPYINMLTYLLYLHTQHRNQLSLNGK